jgi:predicted unusual protein kinase regulating ubiquinone biosynthesis (AarF/ABC1/UbiB family)
VRAAPSARILIARAGGIVDPDALPADVRDAVRREVEAARAAVCVPLRPAEVERVLRTAWNRPPARVLEELDPAPLAITPAGQVHRGVLDGRAVAIKVRRPGVERSVRTDLALLDGLAVPLRAAFPRLDATAALRDARTLAMDELDLEHEASQQRRVARAVRGVDGVTVPRAHGELAAETVLVSDLLDGETLAAGARPRDGEAAARALLDAFRAAVLSAGLVPYDPRASHVVVAADGTLGLLGTGVACAVDRDRAAAALDALAALRDDDAGAFAVAASERTGVLDAGDAPAAHALLREVLAPMFAAEPSLDVAAVVERARAAAPELVALAARAAPAPEDLALGRMLLQLAAVLARLHPRGGTIRA